MALSRTGHALYNYSIRCNLLIIFLLYLKVFWGNLIKNKSLNLNDIVDYLSQCQRGIGCGDKHSVVDSDRNSTKHNNVNSGIRHRQHLRCSALRQRKNIEISSAASLYNHSNAERILQSSLLVCHFVSLTLCKGYRYCGMCASI